MFAVPSFFGYNTTFVSTPVATAATGVGSTSFTANWNAFAGASYYLLDVSTSSSFSSFVGSYQNFVVLSTSQLVSGLTASTTYYYRLRAATGVDADAAAFFSRVYTAGGALSYTEVSATETLVADMKSAGIWTAMRAIYPMVGASAAACAQNLKSSSFTGTFTSGWTFASTGVTPNGTSAYMNTGLAPSTNLSSNNNHISFYSRTQNSSINGVNMGSFLSGSNEVWLSVYYAAVSRKIYLSGAYGTNDANVNNTNTRGLHIGSQTSTTSRKLYFAGSLVATNSTSYSTTYGTNNFYIAANGKSIPTDFTPHQCAFSSIGDGLTDTQASDFYTAVQALQTTLSRQV